MHRRPLLRRGAVRIDPIGPCFMVERARRSKSEGLPRSPASQPASLKERWQKAEIPRYGTCATGDLFFYCGSQIAPVAFHRLVEENRKSRISFEEWSEYQVGETHICRAGM